MENAIDSSIPGGDLPSHVRVLERHFQTHGTPVIIGWLLKTIQTALLLLLSPPLPQYLRSIARDPPGGNLLAHIILGIDYNEQTGQLRLASFFFFFRIPHAFVTVSSPFPPISNDRPRKSGGYRPKRGGGGGCLLNIWGKVLPTNT